jgi:hypothetical protein
MALTPVYDKNGNLIGTTSPNASAQYPTSEYGGYNGSADINGVGSTGIKIPAETDIVPNPLHSYASWTYGWTLWWLSIDDANSLAMQPDVDYAMSWDPTSSYVMAEDGGQYPNQRLPATFGLNYQIQDVHIKTSFGLNQQTGSSNLLEASATILEPYGFTLFDVMASAATSIGIDTTVPQNYTQQPYMLQLDFFGYDDNGNKIPIGANPPLRKRFPVTVAEIKAEITNKGAEYKLKFLPLGHEAHKEEYAKTPKYFTISAGTVKEFFDDLTAQYNEYFKNEITTKRINFGDSIQFDIDPAIAKSKIVDPTNITLAQGDPNANDVSLTKAGWIIPAGSSITKIINKILVQSDYLITEQLKLDSAVGPAQVSEKTLTSVTNLYRTVVQTLYQGTDEAGNTTLNPGIDVARNQHPKGFIYKIHQYTTWKASHPNMPGKFPDSTPHTIKTYNYLYTGLNVDILNLKLNFDTTYYTKIMSYNADVAATLVTADSATDETASNSTYMNQIPSLIASGVPALLAIQSGTQFRIQNIVNNPNLTNNMHGATRPAGVIAADVVDSAQSDLGRGDMLKVELEIVGDPTLIKQDDWLYTPSPTMSTKYNSWQTMSQWEFANKYGHIRTDAGEAVVSLTINTPIDIDTDWDNTGLVFPLAGSKRSLFSGQYYILKVDSKFSNGKFQQTLQLSRYMNGDYASAIANQNLIKSRVDVLDPATGKAVVLGGAVSINQSTIGATTETNTVGYGRH